MQMAYLSLVRHAWSSQLSTSTTLVKTPSHPFLQYTHVFQPLHHLNADWLQHIANLFRTSTSMEHFCRPAEKWDGVASETIRNVLKPFSR